MAFLVFRASARTQPYSQLSVPPPASPQRALLLGHHPRQRPGAEADAVLPLHAQRGASAGARTPQRHEVAQAHAKDLASSFPCEAQEQLGRDALRRSVLQHERLQPLRASGWEVSSPAATELMWT